VVVQPVHDPQGVQGERDARDVEQQRVPVGVAPAVVDQLEAVEVQKADRRRRAAIRDGT
jgi:hypothetical protein